MWKSVGCMRNPQDHVHSGVKERDLLKKELCLIKDGGRNGTPHKFPAESGLGKKPPRIG